jgi:hypothetical protein
MKTCCACKETKELKLFYVNNVMKDGYYARCKKCMRLGKLCRQGRPFGSTKPVKETTGTNRKSGWEEIRLVNPRKEDYIDTYEFLKRIGYKMDESIHQQFCDKHDLKPKKSKPFKNHFSPKDCGMIT